MDGVKSILIFVAFIFIAFSIISTLGAALVPIMGIACTIVVIRLIIGVLQSWM